LIAHRHILGQNLFSDRLSIISHSRNLEGLYIGKLYSAKQAIN